MKNQFTSQNFDPVLALANSNLIVEEGEEFENLYVLRNKVHSESLKEMTEDVEGVLGPGGIPVAKQPIIIPQQGRRFHQDQGPIVSSRPKKELKNVLNRMEATTGPLATLKKCSDTNTRVKVYVRNHVGVRGMMTGFVVAFDKYWNLVLKDVDEVFRKKIKNKTPSFNNVENYVNVSDLSIKCTSDVSEEDMNKPCIWPKPEWKERRSTNQPDAIPQSGPPEGFHHSSHHLFPHSESNTSRGNVYSSKNRIGEGGGGGGRKKLEEKTKLNRERRKTEGFRIEKETIKEHSSRHKDVQTLLAGHEERMKKPHGRSEDEEIERRKKKRGKNNDLEENLLERERIIKELQELVDEDEEEIEEQQQQQQGEKKRTRRRKKYEIRERHVNQLLVRGETVVLIQVLQV